MMQHMFIMFFQTKHLYIITEAILAFHEVGKFKI